MTLYSTGQVVKDTQIISILESEVELDKEGMIDGRQYLFLSAHVLHLLLPDDVAFVQDLHCTEQSHTRDVHMTIKAITAESQCLRLVHNTCHTM